jgi:hypothetical protein
MTYLTTSTFTCTIHTYIVYLLLKIKTGNSTYCKMEEGKSGHTN